METTNGKVEILVSKAKEDRTNTKIEIQRSISGDVISSADTSRQASLDDQHDDHQYVSDERHCLASLTSSSHRRIQSDPITDSRLASWSSSLSDKPVVTTTPSRHDSTESEQRDTFGEASVSQVRPTLVPPSLPASLHRRIHSDPLTDTQLASWGSQDERCFAISTTTSDPTTSRNMTTTTSDVSCGLRPLVTSPAGVAAASSHGNSATDMNNTSADGSSGLVQIGDGAFVSQRVYELMMGSNAANGTQQVERSLGGRGMSKLLGLAGRLPNILHRDPPRRVYTTDSADSSDMTSPPPPPALLSRRTVLSKLSVGLLGRQMSLPAHSFATASADCVAAATHQGSTSLDNSVCSESGIPCEEKESMVEVASGVFANAEDDGSVVVGGHRSHFAPMLATIPSDCDSTRGDDVNILDVCPSSAASESRTLDVTDGVEVVTDELPVDDVTVDIETAASEMCNDGSDEVVIDGLEEEVKMRKHRSGASGKGRKLPYGGVQHSLSDSSINANQDRPPLSRPRSLESLTFSDRLDAAGPSSGSAGDVAALDRPLPGVPLRGPRSTAERVAYTATQPIRRVIQTLMRRAHTDDDFSATVASLHRTPANAEIEAQVNTQVDGSIASSYLWREQQPGTYNNIESGSPSSSTQVPRTANHRRSLSFSGRLALLTERKAANCDTTIDDLVASGCSIQGISSSLSTPICTSPLSHALTGGSDTGSPLLLSSSDSPIINYSRRGTGTSSLTDPSGSPASSNVAGVDGTAKTRTVQFADMSATTSSITRVNAECERDRQHRHQQQYHLASSDLQRKVADDIVRSDSRSSVDRPMSAASRLSPRLGKRRTSAASILSTTSSNFKHVAASDSKASDRYSGKPICNELLLLHCCLMLLVIKPLCSVRYTVIPLPSPTPHSMYKNSLCPSSLNFISLKKQGQSLHDVLIDFCNVADQGATIVKC